MKVLLGLVLAGGTLAAQGVVKPASQLVAEGRWQEALAAMGSPADSAGRGQLSRIAVNAGVAALRAADTALARSDWERAVGTGVAPVEAYQDLGALLLATGHADSSRRVVTRGLSVRPSDSRLLALRDVFWELDGRAAAASRNWRAAESAFGRVLARHPLDRMALVGMGGARLALGDSGGALAAYRRALPDDSAGPIPPLQVLHLSRVPPDSGRSLLLLAEWRGIAALERGSDRAEGATVDSVLRVVLDTVVFATDWGPGELTRLLDAHPHQPLLERYAALLAARGGHDSVALARYDELVRERPADAEVQEGRAAVLEVMGRVDEARDGFSRALDLDPEDTVAFRALVGLDEPGHLEDLLGQIRRLRTRLPRSHPLGEREVEVLQRLGRLEEAQSVARTLNGRPS